MSFKDASAEYAQLMTHHKEGKYLYKPLPHETFHPGQIGYFGLNDKWVQIADLTDPTDLQTKGYTTLKYPLDVDSPDASLWKTRTSESESERSLRGSAGASGAMAGAPVDVSGEVKYKTGARGKAALMTGDVVKYEGFKDPFGDPVGDWVRENAGRLVNESKYGGEIARYGLWGIKATWVTGECAIKMSSGSSRDVDTSFDVAATAMGKLGGGMGSLAKLESENWSVYSSEPGSKGRVVSFSGVHYKMRNTIMKKIRSSPLKFDMQVSLKQPPVMRPIFDESGKMIGVEKVRPMLNSDGFIEFTKVEEEEEKKGDEGEGEEIAVLSVGDIECEGMSEEDIQAGKNYAEEKRKKEEQEILEKWEKHEKMVQAINEAKRQAV